MRDFIKVEKENLEDIVSLTSMQEGILFHYLQNQKGLQYVEQLNLHLQGEMNLDSFKRAWQWVTDANPMLRTAFRWKKLNRPLQMVLKSHTVDIRIHDFSGNNSREPHERCSTILEADRLEAFDLTRVPFRIILCSLPDNRWTMTISNHHILYDGWSTGIILKEFFSAYHSMLRGKAPAIPVKPGFKKYVKMLGDKSTTNKEKEEEFWTAYLRGYNNPGGFLPWNHKVTDAPANQGHAFPFTLSNSLWRRLEELTGKLRVTPAAIFYSAWGILLQSYYQTEDTVFGTPVSGRDGFEELKGIADIVGLFINTPPLRIQVSPSQTLADLIQKTQQSLQHRREWETSALVDIYKHHKLEKGGELFDSLVLIENYPLDRQMADHSDTLRVEDYSISETTNYNVTLSVYLLEEPRVELNVKPGLWHMSYIKQVANHYLRILENIASQPHMNLSAIQLLSADEIDKQVKEFNQTGHDFPAHTLIHQLVEKQAETRPDQIALCGVPHRTHERRYSNPRDTMQITYDRLNRSADRLAVLLRDRGVVPETIVAVMMERSVEMIVTLLAIWKAGGAYLPIDPGYPSDRIKYMLEDSSAVLLLTSRCLAGVLQSYLRWPGEILYMEEWQDRDIAKPDNKPDTIFKQDNIKQDSPLAYTIYTSGSTGKPKGVLVTHRNVARLVKSPDYIEFRPHQSLLLTSALQFDVSTFEIWGALTNGMTLALPTRDEVLHPVKLKEILVKFNIHSMWLTTSLFNQLCQLDAPLFGSLSNLMVGGDALSPVHIERVRQACPGLNVINGYGPSENTSFSTTHRVNEKYENNVPIGRPIPNSTAYIMDPKQQLLPLGVAGELVVGGAGVARGYLNNPGLTSRRFFNSPLGGTLYRTGDLARWLPGGILQFLGRMDYQVKVRGFRIELGEIENCITAYPQVEEAVVVCRVREDGERYLCAYITATRTLDTDTLRDFVESRLPDYMIPSYFTVLDSMPMTANGKIHREALPKPHVTRQSTYVEPRTNREKQLAAIWSDVLAVDKKNIGINDSFFQLGGNSLNIIALAAKIHKQIDIELSIPELLDRMTIFRLANYIELKETTAGSPIPPVEQADFYTASSAQKRMYILQLKEPTTTAYNITGAFQILGPLDFKKMESVFRQLIQRHESLRTSFSEVNSQPVQILHHDVPFDIFKVNDIACPDGMDHIVRSMIRPFDLSRPPLLRIGLHEEDSEAAKHLLIVDMHHIISDGMSIVTLIREFSSLYSGRQLPRLKLQYKNFSHWQSLALQEEHFRASENYWLERFPAEESLPVLELPTDYPRPPVKKYDGHTLHFLLDTPLTVAIRKMAAEFSATPFVVVMAAFNHFLSKISGEEDIVIGTPVSGRRHHDLQDLVGMFVNTLAIRNTPQGEKTFGQFLNEVKTNMFAALENQDYPFEKLVEKVSPSIDESRNPLFDVSLALDAANMEELHIPGLDISPYPYDIPISKFDMTFTVKTDYQAMHFSVAYSSDLYKEQTIRRLIDSFKLILSYVIAHPGHRLMDTPVLTAQQRKQVLYDFNDSTTDYPHTGTLHGLFFNRAGQNPNTIALTGTSTALPYPLKEEPYAQIQISYRQLLQASLRIAAMLRRGGVGKDSIVAVMTERSSEMIFSILGILCAGAAYLPLAGDYPVQRIKYMLEDSGAVLLLSNCPEQIKELTPLCPAVEIIDPAVAASSEEALEEIPASSDTGSLAYVLYTSGTTGSPKGVMVEHGNAVNVVWWFGKTFMLAPGSHVMQISDYIFDPSVNQIFGSLIRGATLDLILKDTVMNIDALGRYIDRHSVNLLYSVPFILNPLLANRPKHKSLHYVLSAGDRLDDAVKDAILQKGYRLFNLYGPTETAIDALWEECSAAGVSLGTPVDNMRCVVIDKYGKLAPIGVSGELAVTGVGVSRGYLNAPQLTAGKFLPMDPNFPDSWQASDNPRLYRTGDRVRLMPDGRFHFQGRLDHQVKVNGYRVELQEIENQLLKYDTIQQCVAIVVREGENRYLCAYYTASAPVSSNRLQDHLRQRLPRQMVPSIFMELRSLPLTAAGKVDRKALPRPEIQGNSSHVPIDPVQNTVMEIWSEVLGVPKETLAPDSHFFQLGGHSLKMTIVSAKIQEQLGIEVPMGDLFQHLTIAELSDHLRPLVNIPPANPIMDTLIRIWSDVLEVEGETLGPDSHFFQLGGHSLKMTIVGAKIQEQLGIEVPMGDLFKHLTIAELSAYLQPLVDIPSANPIMETLIGIWSDVLGMDKEALDPSANFFQLGGHSLKMTIVGAKIQEQLGVEIPMGELFQHLTINELTGCVEEKLTQDRTVAEPEAAIGLAEQKEYYPLSSAQKRMHVLHRMAPQNTGYNIPGAVFLEGELDKEKMENAFEGLVRRHESLRTSFDIVAGGPVQIIHPTVDFSIEYVDEDLDIDELMTGFIRPFDLTRPPLLRVGFNEIKPGEHLLMVDMHHIIADGSSLNILANDFFALYSGKDLPALRIQYKEYSEWSNTGEQTRLLQQQREYWLAEFSGEIPVLNLTTDFARPAIQSFEGDTFSFQLGEEETASLNRIALRQDATLFMVLSGIINVLLYKLSGQEDIVLGAPIAGRGNRDLEPVIGMFVNTLAIRNVLSPRSCFTGFLKDLREKTLSAYENQDYPFEMLVDALDIQRDGSRNPLFDVLFVHQNMEQLSIYRSPDLKLSMRPYMQKNSKFDLHFMAFESGKKLPITLEYCTSLFTQSTIMRIAEYFKQLTTAIIKNDQIPLWQLQIITDSDKARILNEFNRTASEYPCDGLIHHLFEDEAKKQPRKTAVWCDGETLTYKELDQKADTVASYLLEQGITDGQPVGIMLNTSLEMIIAVLGALKAGGAYLPIDPDYPRERIDFMINDSNAALVLTGAEMAEAARWQGTDNTSPKPAVSPDGLCYIIYTSGSTGRPKGVMVEHRSVIRLVKNTNFIDFQPEDRILQTGALEFDASTFEIWGSLLNGLTLYLTTKQNILNPDKLKDIIGNNHITTMWLTSPLFNQTVQADVTVFSGLRNLLVGGDVLSPPHINMARERFPQLQIINGYGPTENTTFSTTFLVDREYKENIPIGKPIANSTAYIVDKYDKLQPVGISGELYVGGDGVARGYLNNPELSDGRFADIHIAGDTQRIYKTGDLARWLPDGNIQFLGRVDLQVKIRGFRIEPHEIENRLLEHETVDEAVVLVKTRASGEKYLAAYFVSHTSTPSIEIREFLSGSMPNYMIPSHIIQLESIPLNANGKVDWRALPEPASVKDETLFLAPRDQVEEKMVVLWSQVLGIEPDKLSIDADFFQMGGHSLKAALLVSKIHKEFNVNIPLTEIFTAPTIAELSSRMKKEYCQKFTVFSRQKRLLKGFEGFRFVLPPFYDNFICKSHAH